MDVVEAGRGWHRTRRAARRHVVAGLRSGGGGPAAAAVPAHSPAELLQQVPHFRHSSACTLHMPPLGSRGPVIRGTDQ